ncbi:uncharacterized protein B4U80_07129 [Leptotrombidium deliense]|uniref:Uncharacterized protein n=1 Tax=Leptotrombidium deliense TaxID=299467 RepID=A0A443SGH2_9ACAR|nr:uncharacterized protein B4U80_07129 [Leptotrombidium deliense]
MIFKQFKFVVVAVAVFGFVNAADKAKPPQKPGKPGKPGTGVSNIFRTQDVKGNYDFGYDITDADGATNFRRETGDGKGNVVGSYGLADVDGRTRVVEYAADKNGFTAAIQTNEPGTSDADAANAVYNGVDKNPKQFSYTFTVEDPPPKDDGKYKPDKNKWAASAVQLFRKMYAAASEPHVDYNQSGDYPVNDSVAYGERENSEAADSADSGEED